MRLTWILLGVLSGGLFLTGCFRPKPHYTGALDIADCNAIQGWGLDTNRPQVPAEISIYDDDRLLVKINADLARPDLGANPNHGFRLSPLPPALLNSQPHKIHVRYDDTLEEVEHSPKLVSCPG